MGEGPLNGGGTCQWGRDLSMGEGPSMGEGAVNGGGTCQWGKGQ